MSPLVDVLLSTYNGEKYLSDQLDSILAQSFQDWHLYIRDDGSIDSTTDIIFGYIKNYPKKITLIENLSGNCGLVNSFSNLMLESSAPYVSLCDQDDVWKKDKLLIMMDAAINAEEKHSSECPLLVQSDLCVVDSGMNILSQSFWKYQNLNPALMSSPGRLLTQNYITGCATLMNRALINLSMPIPKDAIMHDWWIGLIAAIKGKIINIDDATVLYRQHEANDTGAKAWNSGYVVGMLKKGRGRLKRNLLKTRCQAVALKKSNTLDHKESVVVNEYINMFEASWVRRRFIMLRNGFMKFGFIRNIAMFVIL